MNWSFIIYIYTSYSYLVSRILIDKIVWGADTCRKGNGVRSITGSFNDDEISRHSLASITAKEDKKGRDGHFVRLFVRRQG